MRTACLTLLFGAATALGSCGGPPAGEGNGPAEETTAVQPGASTAPAAEATAGDPPLVENDASGANEGGDSVCERVDSAEARRFTGLELTGTSGGYRFYGRPRELLCSEAGAGGVGECEVPGAAEIRVEGPDGVYGFRSTGASPAILTYSPEGVSCRAR